MPICAKCGRETEGEFIFCPHCGSKLTAGPVPREQRKTVTILFCDVSGSTALGESTDPEALRALLARYFERMKGIVESHGGTVEKFIGEVVTGTKERLATGDAVNVAARLEQVAQSGEILIAEPTLQLVREAVETKPVDPLELKGKTKPVPAYRLIDVHEAPERPHESLFVGRERELETLQDAWQRAVDEGCCTLVTLIGDPGIGKSRLAAELLSRIDAKVVR